MGDESRLEKDFRFRIQMLGTDINLALDRVRQWEDESDQLLHDNVGTCPFCGNKHFVKMNHWGGLHLWQLYCPECKASTPRTSTFFDAVRFWDAMKQILEHTREE